MAQQVDQLETSVGPQVWLVTGEKPGDNAQIMNLAEAIGWDCDVKKICVKPQWAVRKPRVRPTLDPIDLARSDSLEAPWPDLVITAGRRLSCVGLWIKRASAGKTRLVMIGKPRRMLESIDLIVAASHYVLKPAPNVFRHDLPLMQADPRKLENAEKLWRSRFADHPRPLTALMVGGPTGGLCFDLAAARDLFEKTIESVEESGGSLYITTSRRTPADVVEMFRRECPESARLFEYDAEALPDENPYYALLALADRFIVTTDSISMMVEVARLGRSLSVYPLESEAGLFERSLTALGLIRPLSPRKDPIPGGGLWARTMYRLGRVDYNRDLSAIPRLLVEKGRACWLGDEWVHSSTAIDDELRHVAERIRGLVDMDVHAESGDLKSTEP
jgi:mitochondrial fission protein ELM1